MNEVDVDEVMALIERRRELNRVGVINAVFVRDGNPVEISQEIRRNFEFTGMSLFDFVELVVFGESEEFEADGVTIKRTPPIIQRKEKP